MNLNVLLISTYEMGRQPFGLASPAAWLRDAGAHVRCLDLSVESFCEDAVTSADLIAFYVPMHMGTRMAVSMLDGVRQINPEAHLCFYGLYASESESYLRCSGVDTILGGEFETGLVDLAKRLSNSNNGKTTTGTQPEAIVSLARQKFLVPDRVGLPDLTKYAHLVTCEGRHLTAGYVEATRGCKHLCRHCPIVPVYNGNFRVVQREVVLEDIRQQVAAGAQHITFGDPDFFNGVSHAIRLVTALHEEHPHLTYDVTIKVEHLLKHAKHLKTLKESGCLFITSAVESFDEHILTIFEKHHTVRDFEAVLSHCRQAGLLLVPTFVAFTPWTTLEGYRTLLWGVARLGLVDEVSPIQYAIRLLIPPGSRLLEVPEVQEIVGSLDESMLSYTWTNPDPRMDTLQKDLERLVQKCAAQQLPRRETFQQIWERTHQEVTECSDAIPHPFLADHPSFVPYLTEPWYC